MEECDESSASATWAEVAKEEEATLFKIRQREDQEKQAKEKAAKTNVQMILFTIFRAQNLNKLQWLKQSLSKMTNGYSNLYLIIKSFMIHLESLES